MDPIAIYAAIVATGALFLEIRRWSESGVKLRLRLISDAQLIGSGPVDSTRYLALTVSNMGDRPTTLTHMVLYDFETLWGRIRNRPTFNAIITNPSENPAYPGLPQKLEIGDQWHGRFRIGDKPDLVQRARNGWLYVGIVASHSEKELSVRVQK